MAFHNINALSATERDRAARIFAEETDSFACPSCGCSIKSMKGLSRRSEIGVIKREEMVRVTARHRCMLCPYEGDLVVLIPRSKLSRVM